MWTGDKPSLRHIQIWGCPAYVLDKDLTKLVSRIEVRLFVGYPRETKGYLFYSLKNREVIDIINARFLEKDCTMNHKPMNGICFKELVGGLDNSKGQ
jgi:hypothetical protein